VLQVHELRPRMETQHDRVAEMAQEDALLDQARRQAHERHRVRLTHARIARIHRRCVEHREQRTRRIANRCRRARQTDMAAVEMFVQVDGDRAPFDDAGTHAIRALRRLAPIGTGEKPRIVKAFRERGFGFLVENDAARIREQQRVTGARDVLIEPIDLRRGDVYELGVLLVEAPQALRIEHSRRKSMPRIERVILNATAPRIRDGGAQHCGSRRRRVDTADETQHVSCVLYCS